MTNINFHHFFFNLAVICLSCTLILSSCGNSAEVKENENPPVTTDQNESLTPEQITAMISTEPDNAQLYYERALAYYEYDDLASALKDFDKTIALEPDFVSAYHDRGICHFELGMLEKSLKDFNKAIELDEEYVEAYFNRSLVYDELGMAAKALDDLNTAIKIDPDFGDAYYNRAVYTLNTNRSQSCSDFQRAAELGIEEAELTMTEYCN
ncbi:MAG: tetratricopeptide repeat protein [Flavobacteriales bacterium]|nr:tetratricopeptide repeat protein [Flavobacteriales bacterium]